MKNSEFIKLIIYYVIIPYNYNMHGCSRALDVAIIMSLAICAWDCECSACVPDQAHRDMESSMHRQVRGLLASLVVTTADSQRITVRISFSRRVHCSTVVRNAAHATVVQRMIQLPGTRHELSFAGLEEAVADLLDVVRVCDEHNIEFEQFAAFDDLLFGQGSSELDAFEDAHSQHMANDDLDPGTELLAPLEGECVGYVHLLDATTVVSTQLYVAIGKYFLLFERPLPALGAFRAAWTRSPESCAAADGVAYCLLLLGLREKGTVPLALRYWESVRPSLSDAPAASSFLATLSHVVHEPSLDSAAAIMQNASRFLRTRGVAAARKLLRQWLPVWLRCGRATQTQARAAAPLSEASSQLSSLQLNEVSAPRAFRDGAAAGAGGSITDTRGDHSSTLCDELGCDERPWAVLLCELGNTDSWLGKALRGSNLFACAALEPPLMTCRHRIVTCLVAQLYSKAPAADMAHLATAAASIACHMLTVGFCVPEAEPETRTVEGACAMLATGAAGTRLRQAAETKDVVRLEDAALLMAIAMYRPLTREATRGMCALDASQLKVVPLADEVIDEHLRKPHARAIHAQTLPRVTRLDNASLHVEAFYRATLYPVWHVPETGDAPQSTIGECLRRHYPWLVWPFDSELRPLRVCIAGAGSGHHVAQAALTLSNCELVALDLSAPSLAYAAEQVTTLLPPLPYRACSHLPRGAGPDMCSPVRQLPDGDSAAARSAACLVGGW